MNTAIIEITEDELVATYPFRPNPLDPNASWIFGDGAGCLFETFGEELEFVRLQAPQTVWTLLEGDDAELYVVSGYHFVNRIGYLISTVPFPSDPPIQVHIPTNSETQQGDRP